MSPTLRRVLGNGAVRFGLAVLGVLTLVALAAPWLGTVDPAWLDAVNMNQKPLARVDWTGPDGQTTTRTLLMGTDSFGRDIYSRVVYGTRISLVVGLTVALLALALGTLCGLMAGYFRSVDGLLMRVMDGLMAIPGILLAIALVAAWGASLATVIVAIAVPEVPRVTRLVRSLVLSIREEPYIEAAISVGTPTWKILLRHVLPNAIAPMIVQGTYVCASAILIEAILSFLGLGLPSEIPTWGNIMAEARVGFSLHPHNMLFPGLALALTVLAVNLLGDGLRDTLDPKFAKRSEARPR
ncbi:MAG: ABC transporter permease [Casimicrobiaceae bacterium]|nr:ABC transporter permease [Casimicrobiaceae bacterium]MCX8099313.1 ABC transporter permease [Casimicrobiaceae bacterium]MDW8312340.1 ABC transporter permease [Burkholderiales bacterium]